MRTRVVLDANIYVSALIKPESPPGNVLKYLLEHPEFELVLSEDIQKELKRVLLYPKVRKYIKRSTEDLLLWLDALVVHSFLTTGRFFHECIIKDDPEDDKYIIAALESSSAYIISGDNHLLSLKNHLHIKILSATQFIEKQKIKFK